MEMEYKDPSKRGRWIVVIGVVLAIAAGGAAFFLINQAQQQAGQGGLQKVAVVVALPLKAPSPDSSFSTSGATLSNVAAPGPRYFDQRKVTGGRGLVIGALVPLVNFMSSAAQTVSSRGADSDAVRAGALARIASGPWTAGPAGSKRMAGGVLPTAISLNGLIT